MSRGEARTPAPEAAPGVRGWLPNATRGGDPSLRALVMPTVREAATPTPGAVFGALSAGTMLSALSGSFDASGACVDWGCPSAPVGRRISACGPVYSATVTYLVETPKAISGTHRIGNVGCR